MQAPSFFFVCKTKHLTNTLFYRDKHCATRADLLPWICNGLRSLSESGAFLPFEVLMDASQGMFDHYKEKLVTEESFNRHLWSPKGKLGLVRIISPATTSVQLYIQCMLMR